MQDKTQTELESEICIKTYEFEQLIQFVEIVWHPKQPLSQIKQVWFKSDA